MNSKQTKISPPRVLSVKLPRMPAALTLPELYDAHAAGLFHYFTGMVVPAFIGIRTGAFLYLRGSLRISAVQFRPLSAGDLLRNQFRTPKALNTDPAPDPAHGWNA